MDFLKVLIGLIAVFLIIFLKDLFLPKNVYSFFISVGVALIVGLWIIT